MWVPDDELNKPRIEVLHYPDGYAVCTSVSDNVAHYREEENVKTQPEPSLPDVVAAVVYDILINEGVLERFTLDDAIANAVDVIREHGNDVARREFIPEDALNLIHAVIKDLITDICPAAEECFDLSQYVTKAR